MHLDMQVDVCGLNLLSQNAITENVKDDLLSEGFIGSWLDFIRDVSAVKT